MSDLSLPPQAPASPSGRSRALTGRAAAAAFAWPTPALPSYPAPSLAVEPEDCEVEGVNGRIISGRLALFDPERSLVQVATPTLRVPVSLRFDQFRRLTLLPPLLTVRSALADNPDSIPATPPLLPYRVRYAQGAPMTGHSASPHEAPYGIFLFEPADGGPPGALRRHFVPRAGCARIDIGERLGDVLVEQHAASRDAVEQAADEQAALRRQRLGDVLLVRKLVTPEQLEEAVDQQIRMPMMRIGEALLGLGFIDQAQLDAALLQQRDDRSVPLGELLVRHGIITRAHLQLALARKMGYPLVDAGVFPAEAEALTRVPYATARRLVALPLLLRGGRLVVAFDDPTRREAIDELEFVSQATLVPVLAHAEDLPTAIDRAYDKLGARGWSGSDADGHELQHREPRDATELLASLEQQHTAEQRRSDDESSIEQSDNSLVRLINSMIAEAQAQQVSDIHIECQPGREKLRIRFRKDGHLRPYLELPHTYRSAIIARLKIMCDLDISERRKPQDGKINFSRFQPGARLELRLATIPTNNGLEDAVLRLLASAKPLQLADLAMSPANLAAITAAVARPYGMLLCVGPTGSGKTTTLHSAMGHINQPDRKIWTAEDPIEITQPGLRQVQVNPKIGWTFERALRAFLRADPDVVMVGEIRDRETAQVAIEASLTGHLVLSTLHTNNAAETVTRLLDMGMDPFNFADSLLAVVAQRLVRRLCLKCRQARDATEAEIDEFIGDYTHAFVGSAPPTPRDELLAGWTARHAQDGRLRFYSSAGCANCDQTGYRSRAAIQEVLTITRTTRRLIQTGARAEQILEAGMVDGMRTLRQDGIEKVLAGLTSIEEVRASTNH